MASDYLYNEKMWTEKYRPRDFIDIMDHKDIITFSTIFNIYKKKISFKNIFNIFNQNFILYIY